MLKKRDHVTTFGAKIVDGAVSYRLWAPNQTSIGIILDDRAPQQMHKQPGGWHEFTDPMSQAGTLYRFQLEDGTKVPDPASRYQPSDIHGPSEVVDPRGYRWNDDDWQGRPWEESVIYELHVGTFTAAGTFRAAIDRLDWLVELGVTAIELMPVADFPGDRNWGYDGVLLFAPDASYGRPEDLKALVDAAHARKLMVFLDVVYNHFGPDGNYLSVYSPVFTETHHTPWGAAVNYDAEGSELIRQFVIENAIYWIEEFHCDGLRLDAVHAIKDDSELHVLEEIAQRVRETVTNPVHLILENEENEASRLGRNDALEPVHYTAQWNDDVHHVLHCAATGETSGYYGEYAGDTEKLGRALAEGFAFQGDLMEYRGTPRGEPSSSLPPTAFVAFIQNHDQVGNRAFGDRLTSFAGTDAVRAIAAIYLLLPQIPMLFMGEEFGASQPFPFFCNFEPGLAKLVREGRRAEFAKFPEFHDPAQRERIPDPTAEQTFCSAKLDWDEATRKGHVEWAKLYRELLAIRHREIVPRLFGVAGNAGHYDVLGDAAVRVSWNMGDGAELILVANLADRPLDYSVETSDRLLWSTGNAAGSALGPWSVRWSINAASDGAGQ
jgi:maltooligosyltrehalose trehalohydrolase